MACYFDSSQITLARRTFLKAEKMAGQYFRLNSGEWIAHRYDVKTLAYLDQREVRKGAFAHLCKYEFEKEPDPDGRGIHFYRICLQDDRILDAVERANSFIRLSPLLLYIAAHELVHVIRFDRGEGNFDASEAEKSEEEETVHRITRNLLKPMTDPDLNLVLECFSNRYQIGDMIQ